MPNRIFVAAFFAYLSMASLAGGKEEGSQAAAKGCRQFSSNFHKVVASRTERNVVNSPLGAHLLLSCLYHGSDKLTAQELSAGLGYSEAENIRTAYKDLVENLAGVDSVELQLANAIFLQKDMKVLEEFRDVAKDYYFTIRNIDFRDKIVSVETIDSWVAENTGNKIRGIVTSDDINDATKVVLANAIYFKGQWRHRFNVESTEKRTFHSTKSRNKQIPTMYKEFKYSHGLIPNLNCRFIEIPYMDSKIDMIVLLPNEIDGLKFLEENFDWNAVVNAKRSTRLTRLYLPKFKIEATTDLKSALIELGFSSMFNNTADFSRMSNLALKIDSVIQKAFIEVNEIGTEAAAATAARVMMKRSLEIEEEPEEFKVDRPFLVAIRHVPNDIPLFLSSVRDVDLTTEKDEL